jgi:membrane-bound serine protease (ClpP class)
MVSMKPLRIASLTMFLLGLTGLALGQAPSPPAPNTGAANSVTRTGVIIEIKGEINEPLRQIVERQLEEAQNENRPLIVLDIDTPGGRVDSAISMSDSILASSVPTVAVVKNAFSAGALIAMSAEQLGMIPGSEIGAALPITGTGQALEGDVGEKINSAVRTKFRSVATTRGRNADAAEGMVNPNKVIAGLKEKGEILTLTAADAVKYNIADFEARTLEDAVRQAGFANLNLERLELTPAQRIGAFFNQPIVAGLLLAIGIIGILIELFHPGVALPGIIGAVALALYFLGGLLTGNGSSVAFILLIAGLLLIAAELVLIPGSTLVGLLGLGCVLASVYLQFGDQFGTVAGIAVIGSGIGIGLALWRLPRSRLAGRFFLETSLAGATATSGNSSGALESSSLIGRFGTAVSDLRPAGVANIEGERLDVVSDGEFIKAGTTLEVIRVEGRRVLVKARNVT